MAPDLKIELEVLHVLARDLQTLHTELSSAGQGRVDDGIGSPRVEQAVTAFADDWAIARGRMLESIAAVGTMAESAAKTFDQVERELAVSLSPSDAAAAS